MSSMDVVKLVVYLDRLVGVLHDGCGFCGENGQLGLRSFGESDVELVDVGKCVLVEIGYDILEFRPIQHG